jgi:hypothetical protein
VGLATLLFSFLASATEAPEAGGYDAGPSKPAPDFASTRPGERSPAFTQDRVFAGSPFWRLDSGSYAVEVWVDDKLRTHEGLLQLALEVGIAPHLQLDLYESFNFGTAGFSRQGEQLELRVALGSAYNAIPLNPVLYVEWAPRHNAQDRAELRLLLGGDLGERLLWAANLFGECNLDDFQAAYSQGLDAEAGLTASASYELFVGWLRVGAEGRGGVAMHGSSAIYPSLTVGPSVLCTLRPAHLKLTATAFFGMTAEDPKVRLLVIAGYAF